jgi:hypothetical protein
MQKSCVVRIQTSGCLVQKDDATVVAMAQPQSRGARFIILSLGPAKPAWLEELEAPGTDELFFHSCMF